MRPGAATAKYAGQHVHQRLVNESAYKESRYSDALKNAFLGADVDMKEGVLYTSYVGTKSYSSTNESQIQLCSGKILDVLLWRLS